MIRPSLVLSIFTALLASEISLSTSAPASSSNISRSSLEKCVEESSEEQDIVNEARRTLGNELTNL
jgi:hypothetical protein